MGKVETKGLATAIVIQTTKNKQKNKQKTQKTK